MQFAHRLDGITRVQATRRWWKQRELEQIVPRRAVGRVGLTNQLINQSQQEVNRELVGS